MYKKQQKNHSTYNLITLSPDKLLASHSGQALVEFILFTLIIFTASYGMLKLFIYAWTKKFDFISVIMGTASALF